MHKDDNNVMPAVFNGAPVNKQPYAHALCSFFMLLSFCKTSHADNWHGSITTKLQVDNRLTKDESVFAEAIGRFEYDNKQYDLKGGADVLLRGGNYDFNTRQDFYRLFLQKGFSAINTTVKLGRFEQTDAMGFYTLNGLSAVYQNDKKDLSVEVYAGKPQRFDDLQSAKGNMVAGVKGFWHYEPKWQSEFAKLSIDALDIRLGYQYFEGQDMSRYNPSNPASNQLISTAGGHKLSLGANVSGQLPSAWLKKYESRLIGIYRLDTNTVEDLQVETQVDVNAKTRIRGSYEYYNPNRFANPTFREQFYSQQGFGKQQLLRVSVHHQWQDYFTAFLGGIHSAQVTGDDGYGFNGGISSRYFRNYNVSFEVDHLHINQDKATAFYLKNEYFVNSRNSVMLSLALRNEEKQLNGENWAKGAEARWNYMLKNNIVLGVTAKYISNSRDGLSDEFLAAVQVTYYFDNFKPKIEQ
ncbi:MAG: hypothetical protein HOP02_09665 [Methylococcaceae bacterium]|nr:hypothetical protein [Methylococcaceae bacterium]